MGSVPNTTAKKLFALSGNICAFPGCSTLIYDNKSGAMLGEICHIKARNEGGPRYDPDQNEQERHALDNLILLCPNHHEVIDTDHKSYTVERLLEIKNEHESSSHKAIELDDNSIQRLIDAIDQQPSKKPHQNWFSKHELIASKASTAAKLKGFLTVTVSGASTRNGQASVQQLLSAVDGAQIQDFGYPLFKVSGIEEYTPYDDDGSLCAKINNDESFIYWSLRENGDIYLRKSYWEDYNNPGKFSFDVRAQRIAESLTFIRLYYNNLVTACGVKIGKAVDITFTHSDLNGRELISDPKVMQVFEGRIAKSETSTKTLQLDWTQMPHELLSHTREVCDDLVNKFTLNLKINESIYEKLLKNMVDRIAR